MSEFIRVTYSDNRGSLTCRLDQLHGIIDEEIDFLCGVGNSVTFTAIEMTEEEYKELPEFAGW